MDAIPFIGSEFIENHTDFTELVHGLQKAFKESGIQVPPRHHHSIENPGGSADNTLLLMPAWNPGQDLGIKVITVSPDNGNLNLPSINGSYIYYDAPTGTIRAILEAKALTAKRTAATSALASQFLSRKNSSSLLMIGTGALATNLIRAHAAVRPLKQIYVWGRNREKADAICAQLRGEPFMAKAISHIKDMISEVDIISCATLSETPLVLGQDLRPGQHVDLVGAFKPTMRESDNAAILKSSVYLDTRKDGLRGSGDISQPIANWIISEGHIKGDLFDLCREGELARRNDGEITVFKSVGYALEDLVGAAYYYNLFKKNE